MHTLRLGGPGLIPKKTVEPYQKKGKPKLPINNTHPKPRGLEKGRVLDLSKLAHRESLKRSHVGVGGLEVRGRQRLALTWYAT